MAERPRYPSDLTDEQWELVEPALARNGTWGRPREVDVREVINALLYLVRTGCPWDYLPHDFPHRSTVRYYFDKWRQVAGGRDLVRAQRPAPAAGARRSRTPSRADSGDPRPPEWEDNRSRRQPQVRRCCWRIALEGVPRR